MGEDIANYGKVIVDDVVYISMVKGDNGKEPHIIVQEL